ncbi:hypothetical protein [Olleya sp. Bg11-27]|uniref:hypothetical protein n=1 Tax=Olleya sp. Bg11-27 TaxID=2058135 RepID=UPI000C31948F|nr:hypothetical protein [Olleya sp. Bg11-27]AUC75489.1 hypothetical protein CW732_07275 [Olleya sp. Bg11-27]
MTTDLFYTLNGTIETLNVVADGIGQINVDQLFAVLYQNVILTDNISACSQNFTDIIIISPFYSRL